VSCCLRRSGGSVTKGLSIRVFVWISAALTFEEVFGARRLLEQEGVGTTAGVAKPRQLSPPRRMVLVYGEDDEDVPAAGDPGRRFSRPGPAPYRLEKSLKKVFEGRVTHKKCC